jgi:hypothetical protein
VLDSSLIKDLNVFISYSRPDMAFADELVAGLQFAGAVVTIDRHSIREGEDWKVRLSGLIATADTIVFVLSPASAKSAICAWEVETATSLGKRILPVLWRPLDGEMPPARLTELNYVRFDEDRSFMNGLKSLIIALGTNLEWLRDHTQLLSRALDWDRGGRIENRLMSGEDIAAAKKLVADRPRNAPEITSLQLDFIRASEAAEVARNDALRDQIEERSRLLNEAEAAAAQRAEALSKAEAALQVTKSLRRRQQIGLTVFIMLLALGLVWSYGVIEVRQAMRAEAARVDISGQLISYATSPGADTDVTPVYETSYADSISKQIAEPNKSVITALIEAHKEMNALSDSRQRPILSNSLNGFIYLARQPASRRKRAILVSVDEDGSAGSRRNVDTLAASLRSAGFSAGDIMVLHNPLRSEIKDALEMAGYALEGKSPDGSLDAIVKARMTIDAAPVAAPPNTMLLFFFSGPGVEIDDEDYLLPRVDRTSLDSAKTAPDKLISVQNFTERFEELAAASIVILDTHFPKFAPEQSRQAN